MDQKLHEYADVVEVYCNLNTKQEDAQIREVVRRSEI
jgi:hypothetical protein